MDTAELREKSVTELETELTALYKEQFSLRMSQGTGQDVKPHNYKRVRRQIARIKTIITQKSVTGTEA